FNARGDLTLSDNNTGQNTTDFIYDDIAIFPGCLTVDDINTIATANKPLAEIDQSLLSVQYAHYYPATTSGISNLSDARMDRINRIARLQRWLGLPYDQVDLLVNAVGMPYQSPDLLYAANATSVAGKFGNALQTRT
ncbi:hypothetical protein DOJ06_24265, partial [Salmonella enterica subsp. enterica serovar Bareilly]|nr:hypothetical protein [Salmonella enterica subsp. enterica serovar Bareilly]